MAEQQDAPAGGQQRMENIDHGGQGRYLMHVAETGSRKDAKIAKGERDISASRPWRVFA
jgi:hypothetical protein